MILTTVTVCYIIGYLKTHALWGGRRRPIPEDDTPLTGRDIRSVYNFTQVNTSHPKLTYILYPTTVCGVFKGNASNFPHILIIVKSLPESFHIRQWLRYALQHYTESNEHFKIVFLLGQSKSSSTEELIKEESKRHSDIIQGNFTDIGRNTTYKTIMGFRWALHYCQETQFLFFQDEDIKINFQNLLTFLKEEDDPESLYVGKLLRKEKLTFKDKKHPKYIPREEYPLNSLPPYISTGAYILSIDVATTMESNFDSVKMVHVDDVFLALVAMFSDVILMHSKKIALENCAKFRKNIACRTFTSVQDSLDVWKEFAGSNI